MKKLFIIILFVFSYSQTIICQNYGLDIGLGVNSYEGDNDTYTKIAIDLGLTYKINEKVIFGFDVSVSPKEDHENTGVDGSRSTHEKWDGSATCFEFYGGPKFFKRIFLFGGIGICTTTEYEIMKGYSNLTSYKRGKKNLNSYIIGAIYDFRSNLYLKYDMTISEYEKYSLAIGLNF